MTTFTDEVRETVSPYKFSGSRRAAAAWLVTLDSDQDEETGDTDWHGWYARVGRTIVQEDSRGFVDAFRYASEEEAREAFAAIESDYAKSEDR